MTDTNATSARVPARRSARISKRKHRASTVNQATTLVRVPNLVDAIRDLQLGNEEPEESLGGVMVEYCSDLDEQEDEDMADCEEVDAMDTDDVQDIPPRSLMAAIRLRMQELGSPSPTPSRAISRRDSVANSSSNDTEKKVRRRCTVSEKLLVANAVHDKRLSHAAVAKLFGIGRSTVGDILKQYARGDLSDDAESKRVAARSGGERKITDEGSTYIIEFLAKYNSATLRQIQTAYLDRFDVQLGLSTIYDHLRRQCKLSLKRAVFYPEKRNADETKDKRQAYVKEWISSGILEYERNCVFIDEASYNQSRTLLAAISHEGLVGASIKEGKGGTKSPDFLAFLEEVMDDLDGKERRGWYLVCDNASIHKTKIIQEAVEKRGYHMVYLPPYSPFLNPIEEFFSKVKAVFRRVAVGLDPENAPLLHERLAQAIAEVRPEDYAGWARHATTFFEPCLGREDML